MNFFIMLGQVASIIALICVFLMDYSYYLHMFQLNSYFPERYRNWKKQGGQTVFRKMPKVYQILTIIWFVIQLLWAIAIFIFQQPLRGRTDILMYLSLWTLISILGRIKNQEKVKKPLVYTKRIYRLILVQILPYLLLVGILRMVVPTYLAMVFAAFVFVYTAYYLVYPAYYLLKPLEDSFAKKFYSEAKFILEQQPNLIKIGITGSYGKTSTKFILENVLKTHYLTLVTPHSYNTTLGVVRTVREHFSGNLEAFVAEMGAKQSGDIQEICDLVHPTIGVITAVGPQHLETFGNIENVIATKFELARAVGKSGVVIVNYDDANIRTGMARYPEANYLTYGENKEADVVISEIQVSEKGSSFGIAYQGQKYAFQTKLLGKHNISNLAAGIALGLYLKIAPEQIAIGIRQTKPVEHRLQLKMQGSYYILDDAFNSNPVGANNALEVLKSFPNGRKVIMTPGMIELGSEDERIHYEFGQHMAECVDIAILVGEKKTAKIKEGLLSRNFPAEAILTVPNVYAGFAAANTVLKAGDVLLIENDLPDNY